MGVGAAAGLALATQIGTPEQAARVAWLFVVAGALAGAVHSYVRLPDAPVCRIPWWLNGCGGESTIRDTDGNSRPKAPCWGHPTGKPRRIVHLALALSGVALGGLALLVAVAASR